jgi:hypothetical protein
MSSAASPTVFFQMVPGIEGRMLIWVKRAHEAMRTLVVPAKAGTHTPRPAQLDKKDIKPSANDKRL